MHKVTIPLIALLLLALSSPELCAQPSTPPRPSASVTPTFATGWIIHVYKAPDDLKQLPTDALGSFIDTSGAPYAFHLYKQQPALAWYKGTPAYGFEGWLEAKQPGRHSLILEVLLPHIEGKKAANINFAPARVPTTTCRVVFQMEDATLIDQEIVAPFRPDGDGNLQTVLPSGVDLEPGFYRVKAWTACNAVLYNEENQTRGWRFHFDPTKVVLNIRLKRPPDAVAQPATAADFLHQVK